ncbi:hypothetical protein [Colwellia sp. 75C3]|uniref:hypothetical protein n=1 Tax=Colwellia sp. 75C3 TaxID=888425 RepID=UPI000C33649C|nr:hypothetical protein [Colwellia sp. 75C3]
MTKFSLVFAFFILLILPLSSSQAKQPFELLSFDNLVSDTVKQVKRLVKKRKLAANSQVAIKIALADDSDRPCQSKGSIELEQALTSRLLNKLPLFRFPAFEQAKLLSFYADDAQFNEQDWLVDLVIFIQINTHYLHDSGKPVAKLTLKVIRTEDSKVMLVENYLVKGKPVKYFTNPVKCECERMCQESTSLFTKERIVGAFKQLKKCRLNSATQLLSLPNCSSEIMSQGQNLKGSTISAKFFEKSCAQCGGAIPSYDALDNLRLCLPFDERGQKSPCMFKGELSLCTIGTSSVKVTDLPRKKRIFTALQCEFQHQ